MFVILNLFFDRLITKNINKIHNKVINPVVLFVKKYNNVPKKQS